MRLNRKSAISCLALLLLLHWLLLFLLAVESLIKSPGTRDNYYFLVLCEVKTLQLRILSCLLLADVQEEVTLGSFKTIGVFKESFSHEAFNIGHDQFTFKVHVFDIKGFISLKVSVL